jgi:hypothetical protein
MTNVAACYIKSVNSLTRLRARSSGVLLSSLAIVWLHDHVCHHHPLHAPLLESAKCLVSTIGRPVNVMRQPYAAGNWLAAQCGAGLVRAYCR